MGPGIPARPAPLRPAGGPEGPRFRALQLGATPNPIGGRPDMPDQPLTDPEENA